MSSIRTGIELQDNFSPVLDGIMTSVSEAVSGMEQMQHTMDAGVDTSAIASAASDIDAATAAARELAGNWLKRCRTSMHRWSIWISQLFPDLWKPQSGRKYPHSSLLIHPLPWMRTSTPNPL